ncbi:hypothetical protein OPQ81_010654 [Rhizoctonia solani]|nr:hypothetical protein OPQ81_010654 [Rhizoctonia solani]
MGNLRARGRAPSHHAPQDLANSPRNVFVGGAQPTYAPDESSSALSGNYPCWSDVLAHPMRSETGTHVKGQVPRILYSPSLSSESLVVDAAPFPRNIASDAGPLRIKNIDPDHVILRTSKLVDVAFDEFFEPTSIREGGILILIVSCHGFQAGCGNVLLQFKTQYGTIVDSRMLQEKILALPKHCTLEVVVDSCCAEGVIPGLGRISTMGSTPYVVPSRALASPITHTPPSGSRLNFRVPIFCSPSNDGLSVAESSNQRFPFFEEDRPKYKAQVVVWAASTISGKSYTEEDLPEKPGTYSILIGAIFSYLSLNGPNINRREVWNNVLKVVEQHNDARHKRDLSKPPEIQANLLKANRVQTPVLLTSVENLDHVLSGFIFQPI